MELEDMLMRNVMQIAANARRKPPCPPRPPHGPGPHLGGMGRILDLLAVHDGMSQQQIADRLGIRPQSASEAIANMETAGLVQRQANQQDKRSTLIFITPEGKHKQAEMLAERIRNAKRVFAPLREEEKETLLQLLSRVNLALQENKEES